MSFPLINPYQQFFDSSGSPLVSGTIEFRNPATDSLINSYPTADDADAQTNANANPLTLNASGAAASGIFLEDGVPYKVVLKDSAGATVATHDDVLCPVTSPWSSQSTAESSAGVTPSDFSYDEGDTRRYGSTGDGVADDTTSLQSAFDVSANSGSAAFIPRGTYRITAGLQLSSNTNVICEEGAVLVRDYTYVTTAMETQGPTVSVKNLGDFSLDDNTTTYSDISWIGGEFQATDSAKIGQQMTLMYVDGLTVRDVRITSSYSEWTMVIQGDDVDVSDIHIDVATGNTENNTDGFHVVGGNNIRVNNVFSRAQDDAFVIGNSWDVSCNNFTVSNVISESTERSGFRCLVSRGSAVITDPSHTLTNGTISNIRCQGGYLGFSLEDRGLAGSVRNITVSNVVVDIDANPNGSWGYGFAIRGCRDISCDNITVVKADREPLWISTSDGISVTNFRALEASLTGGDSVQIQACRDVFVKGVAHNQATAAEGVFIAGCENVEVDMDLHDIANGRYGFRVQHLDAEIIGDLEGFDDAYEWTNTVGSEYRLDFSHGTSPRYWPEPSDVLENDVAMTPGTAGSLAAGEWDYSGGAIHVRLADSTDPDTKANDYVERRLNSTNITLSGVLNEATGATGNSVQLISSTLQIDEILLRRVDATGLSGTHSIGTGIKVEVENCLGMTPVTFANADLTPSVVLGNVFYTDDNARVYTDLDDGYQGKEVTIISLAAITYDTTGTNLVGSSVDIVTAAGDVTRWICDDGTTWRLIAFVDVSVDNSAGA